MGRWLRKFRAWVLFDLAAAVDAHRAEMAGLRDELNSRAELLAELHHTREDNWRLTRQVAELTGRLRLRSGV